MSLRRSLRPPRQRRPVAGCPSSVATSEESSRIPSKTASGRLKRKRERLAWNARHERTYQPAQAGRDVAGQRHRLALEIHTAVTFQHAPVGVLPPQIASVSSDWFLSFPGGSRVLDLRDPGTYAPAFGTVRRRAAEPRIVLAVD